MFHRGLLGAPLSTEAPKVLRAVSSFSVGGGLGPRVALDPSPTGKNSPLRDGAAIFDTIGPEHLEPLSLPSSSCPPLAALVAPHVRQTRPLPALTPVRFLTLHKVETRCCHPRPTRPSWSSLVPLWHVKRSSAWRR